MATGVVLTYRDYEALPADGRRYELQDGQLFATAAPGVPHQRVVGGRGSLPPFSSLPIAAATLWP